MNEQDKYPFSNCLIQALKAKIKWKNRVRIIYISPHLNHSWIPHFMWVCDQYVFDWHAEKKNLKWYDEFWHRGWIRKRSFDVYKRCEDIQKHKYLYTRKQWRQMKER